jgi:membrane-bound lytic murein transglycosylase MltF
MMPNFFLGGSFTKRAVVAMMACAMSILIFCPSNSFCAEALIEAASQTATGDLSDIRKRRVLRVLVNYSRSNFFYDGGQSRGFEYELMTAYGNVLNKGVKKHKKGIRVLFIPVRFDELIDGLLDGKGDIAAAGLTITPERQRKVDFTQPYLSSIDEVVVTARSTKGINSVKDLLGRTVYVRKGSSYAEHLRDFNQSQSGWFSKKVNIREMDALLVTEDILEMINAGIVDLTVADHHIAAAWAKVLPNIVVRSDLVVHNGGDIAWAVRKNSPKLLASLNAFIKSHKKGTRLGNIIYNRYYENDRWIKNAMTGKAVRRLTKTWPLFVAYGKKYDFDPMILAALAFQESRLDNNKKSHRGAVGIMQVRPETAADRNIAIRHPEKLENNIHAGTKYLAFIRSRYFSAPEIAPTDQVFFSLAAYNAGPARINQLRKLAARKGLDPDAWFFNVEVAAAEKIGRETVTYVANIAKYYITYRMQFDYQEARLKVKNEMIGKDR